MRLLPFRLSIMVLCALFAPAADAADLSRGYTLLHENCSRCHAIGRTGESPHPQAPPFREVMKIYPASSLSEALAEGLVTGHPDMPEFVFGEDDVAAIVSYLQSLEP